MKTESENIKQVLYNSNPNFSNEPIEWREQKISLGSKGKHILNIDCSRHIIW